MQDDTVEHRLEPYLHGAGQRSGDRPADTFLGALLDDLDQLETVDKQIDDGNLATGNLQLGSTNSLVFIIEK